MIHNYKRPFILLALATNAVQAAPVSQAQLAAIQGQMAQLQQQVQRLESANKRLQTETVPVGSVMAFAQGTIPNGWLPCDGSAYSEDGDYKRLFTIIDHLYEQEEAIEPGKFRVPDLRGEFVRGYSGQRLGVDEGRHLGSWQEDAIRNITGKVSFGDNVNNSGALVFGASGAFGMENPNYVWYEDFNGDSTHGLPLNSRSLTLDVSQTVPTAEENRPRNVAMMYAIKY